MELEESLKECVEKGTHLKDCDNDGFCNHCGYQDNVYLIEMSCLLEKVERDELSIKSLIKEAKDYHEIYSILEDYFSEGPYFIFEDGKIFEVE